jgi:transposase
MRYIVPQDRYQIESNFGCLDDMIEPNNIVRVIDYFVDGLDLKALDFTKAIPEAKGRKPYNPKHLLKLYIYGYLNRIQSSRLLEKETKRNIELKWLLGNLSPDFKTIADFRKDNRTHLKKVFREFTYICRSADLIDFQLTAIDGSFFSAVNHNAKNYSQSKIKKLLEKLDAHIELYLAEMNRSDQKEFSKGFSLEEQLTNLKQKKAEYQAIQKVMKETGETQISDTDPDSKMTVKAKSKMDVSYNVQTAVDSKNHLIVEYDVTNDGNDMQQLSRMSQKVKETHELESLTVTADAGYSTGAELSKCKEMNVETFVPILENRKSRDLGKFSSSYFRYNPENDSFICPIGRELPYYSYEKHRHQSIYGSSKTCTGCEHCSICASSGISFRKIYRSDFAEVIEEQRQRNKLNKDKLESRKMIVEHPFGTIKHSMKFDGFLTKRLPSVNGEFGLAALSYNFKRAFNILGFDKLIEAIQRYYYAQKSRKKAFSIFFLLFFFPLSILKAKKMKSEHLALSF